MTSLIFEPGAVSIHAPVKGATITFEVTDQVWGVSIHAPVKGATSKSLPFRSPEAFQFTHP